VATSVELKPPFTLAPVSALTRRSVDQYGARE
jgi:hypothetical protein